MGKKTKPFQIKVEGSTWILKQAELRLDDQRGGSGIGGSVYNHPRLHLSFTRATQWGQEEATVPIQFQRDSDLARGLAEHYMDTRSAWGPCYAARIELSHKSSHIRVQDRPYRLDDRDRLAESVARIVARRIAARNLGHISACECVQIVTAVKELGADVDMLYSATGQYADVVDLFHVEGRGANRREAEAEAAKANANADARAEADASARD